MLPSAPRVRSHARRSEAALQNSAVRLIYVPVLVKIRRLAVRIVLDHPFPRHAPAEDDHVGPCNESTAIQVARHGIDGQRDAHRLRRVRLVMCSTKCVSIPPTP